MIRMMKAAIFDLDGVIVDTAKYHYWAWKRLARELGFEFAETDNERLKGVSRMRSLEILLEVGGVAMDEATRRESASRKDGWYVEYVEKMNPSELLPGAVEYVRHIRSRGVRTAIASASRNAPLIIHRVQIGSLFDAVVDGTKVSRAKPEPDVFLRAARELGIAAQDCVVFEDAEAGIEAAIRAGMGSVGVGKMDYLQNADLVIPSFQPLLVISRITP
ncbi:MAG: beta-phosphoglucomutase [Anaerolineales bacterium]|nr:beta-phosphoglucomutase [Anaerolineales bacterium]